MQKKIFILVVGFCFAIRAFSGDYKDKGHIPNYLDSAKLEFFNWFNLDREEDNIEGVSTERAYDAILKNKESKTVIVGIIDSGIDTNHEDLQGKIWVNKDEIPDNGIDDDNNGFIDDIHGWNFLGNSQGEMIVYENLESTRIYRKYSDLFKNKKKSEIAKEDRENYKLFLSAKKDYETGKKQAEESYERFLSFESDYLMADSVIAGFLNKEVFTFEDIKEIDTIGENDTIKNAYEFLFPRYQYGFSSEIFNKIKSYNYRLVNYHYNLEYTPREIIGDDPENTNDNNYGNNIVFGEHAEHGTHVAGIVAANRDNDIGTRGIVENVKIMVLRVVPDGDERDKDVANAIHYAVDNGARVINMSFGKKYSPQKYAVDEAIKYAQDNNVLLVHAAGNDSRNIDKYPSYPIGNINKKQIAKNWISVGATSKNADDHFIAGFTNYGKKTVDVFAPGVKLLSSLPGNQYEIYSGTSMASPVVAGVAALLISYYPELSAVEVKDIIMKSSTPYETVKVLAPYEKSKGKKPKLTTLNKLSVTGGVVNAYNAVLMAEKLVKSKEIKN
ncbi:MAG: S8 family peptidase [Bacteroidales bacterium]|nr:S8 family peptidase [Bacteroidales bacterium]